MWQSFKRIILTGLIAMLPFAATLWILQLIFSFLEGLTAPILRRFGIEIPGMGLILTLVMIFFLGLFITNIVGRRLYNWGERILHNIPMVVRFILPSNRLQTPFPEPELILSDR